ncbi:hypothetical protein PUN28_017949 [Cardiocondyla obscurior]|uniref:Uncharacterized protein n=1 Tax=Cardiocondyla obscurior TaxID=286306 RepID=A0AAW2EL41_9HYME
MGAHRLRRSRVYSKNRSRDSRSSRKSRKSSVIVVASLVADPPLLDSPADEVLPAELVIKPATMEGSQVDNNTLMPTEEISKIFGSRIYEDQILAPDLCPDLAVCLEDILKKGILEDILKEVIKKYPPLKTCVFFGAPKLKPVVKSVMQDTIIKRDARIMSRQEKISAALAGMVQINLSLTDHTAIAG